MKTPALVLLLISLLSSIPLAASAQTSTDIQSSRPGAAIGINVVGTKIFQAESGFQRLRDRGANEVIQDTWVTELRYGLSENLELTSEFDLETDRAPGEPDESGISDFEVGLKYLILSESKGLLPALSARARVQLPGGQASFFQKNPAPVFILASSWELSESVAFEADLGVRANTDDGNSDSFYALNMSADLTDNLNAFIEVFHGLEDETGNVEVDAGVAYLLTSNLQLDGAIGWGRHDGTTETLVSAGLSWRLPTGH